MLKHRGFFCVFFGVVFIFFPPVSVGVAVIFPMEIGGFTFGAAYLHATQDIFYSLNAAKGSQKVGHPGTSESFLQDTKCKCYQENLNFEQFQSLFLLRGIQEEQIAERNL